MTAIDVAVLGELAVVRDGVEVPVTGPGRRSLLALLAACTGQAVPTARIVDELWGEEPPASAVKVVQTYVSQLRQLLEPGTDGSWTVLVTRPSGYELAVDPDAVDARRFEAAVGAAADLPLADAVGPLRRALRTWRGPPYAGIDRPFARAEAERLQQLRSAAQVRCLAGELERGRHVQIEPELRALAAERPLDEPVAELLMVALYRAGRQADALAVHAELRRRLADELGVDPGPSIGELHERILRHDDGLGGPTGRTPAARAHQRAVEGNLPPERSSFVGRQDEIAEIATMVSRHRLTSLVGAGGAGKTRLALRVARAAADRFDGVWLIALGTLDDPAHLDGHCLTELGITDQMDRSPGDTLRAWVGDTRLLLVLDNCEHVVAAAAELADRLLAACPGLHVLATSRQPLHCPGERQWRVPTLGLPAAPEAHAVATSEAGSLFLDRAAEASPTFHLDATTAQAVFQVCRRLDGIPLAIELAAVRMAAMSATDLAAGLDHRFQLLTSGSRTALPRHRTLLATTDWSYTLLSSDQQRLLRRLSVFVSDFDVAAATDVCGFAPLSEDAVPGLLADLVDQSLVEPPAGAGEGRYRLLETVREYGRERLGGEAEELARRYGDWVARLSEAVGSNAHVDTARWYGRLDREFRHLQGAFGMAMRRGDAETALRIAAGSGWALIIIGRFHRQREWLDQALALARRVEVDDRVMAQGLLMAGAVAGIDQRFEGTLELLADAEDRYRAVGDADGALWVGYWRAATLAEMGSLRASLAEIEATSQAAERGGRDLIEAVARAEQAELVVAAAVAEGGRPGPDVLREARSLLDRARELARAQEMQELLARVGLGDELLTALQGEPAAALPRALDQLDAWRELGRGNRLILGLIATAKVALLAGRPSDAWPLAGEAIRLIGEFAWAAPLRGALEVLVVLLARRDPERAVQLLGAAESRRSTHRWRMPTDLEGTRAFLRDTLPSEVFDTRYAEGCDLDLDAAVAAASEALIG